jgi:hypothetical protein
MGAAGREEGRTSLAIETLPLFAALQVVNWVRVRFLGAPEAYQFTVL